MARVGGKQRTRPIRVGVVGAARGMSFARGAEATGMRLVALCDTWEQRLREAKQRFPDVRIYTHFDRFLEHDMDAVILANYFHEHAPFAVKALEAGLHVMSETSACKTLAEGVALVRAVEQSGKIYMLAENYCFFAYNQEMRRLYQEDEIGEVRFAECEYNHPIDQDGICRLSPGINHWRNWIPSTYYCTHAFGPILFITERRPVSVNALSIPYCRRDTRMGHAVRGDPGSSILVRLDNGAVVHVFGLKLRGHSIWYRLHGTRGLMENLRTHGDQGKLRIVHEPWDQRRGDVREKIYTPDFPLYAAQARAAGHGGGDFFTNYFFAEAIRLARPPFLDVYRALDMTLVGIQAWRSALADGAPMPVPDLRKEAVRHRYENDHWSPFAEDQGPGAPPPSIRGLNPPSPRRLKAARKVWRSIGYTGT